MNLFNIDISKYQTISFDLFDTLLLRTYSRDTLFNKIDKILPNFYTLRKQAETLAYNENKYFTYKQIYKHLPFDSNIEQNMEKNFIYVNQEMLNFYNYCCKEKNVIITSDMYFGKDFLEPLCNSLGIFNYSKFLVSSDMKMAKYDNTIFDKYITRRYKDVLHIDDREFNYNKITFIKYEKMRVF